MPAERLTDASTLADRVEWLADKQDKTLHRCMVGAWQLDIWPTVPGKWKFRLWFQDQCLHAQEFPATSKREAKRTAIQLVQFFMHVATDLWKD